MSLPDHRRAIHGRTWPQMHRHADFAAVERFERAGWRVAHLLGPVILVGLIAALALGVL